MEERGRGRGRVGSAPSLLLSPLGCSADVDVELPPPVAIMV